MLFRRFFPVDNFPNHAYKKEFEMRADSKNNNGANKLLKRGSVVHRGNPGVTRVLLTVFETSKFQNRAGFDPRDFRTPGQER
jgi:hypothetical protein